MHDRLDYLHGKRVKLHQNCILQGVSRSDGPLRCSVINFLQAVKSQGLPFLQIMSHDLTPIWQIQRNPAQAEASIIERDSQCEAVKIVGS